MPEEWVNYINYIDYAAFKRYSKQIFIDSGWKENKLKVYH